MRRAWGPSSLSSYHEAVSVWVVWVRSLICWLVLASHFGISLFSLPGCPAVKLVSCYSASAVAICITVEMVFCWSKVSVYHFSSLEWGSVPPAGPLMAAAISLLIDIGPGVSPGRIGTSSTCSWLGYWTRLLTSSPGWSVSLAFVDVPIFYGTWLVELLGFPVYLSSVLSFRSAAPEFLLCSCFPEDLLGPFLLRVLLSSSKLMLDMEMMVGMSTGTPNDVSGLLPSPGHPVSGLATSNMTMSGGGVSGWWGWGSLYINKHLCV